MKRIAVFSLLAVLCCVSAWGQQGFLKGKVLRIDLKETIDERSSGGGINLPSAVPLIGTSSSTVSLLDVERAIAKAADDKEIAMILLKYDNISAGMAVREELRSCLQRFRASGKPVVAYGASLSNGSYYLASVADRVFLNPKGGGTLSGINSTQYFVKDLLDTLGIQVQLIRHGKFKSAGEMYIRNDISPENRRQYEALEWAIWSTVAGEIAESRGIPVDSLNAWVNNLELSTADTWLDKGLVDALKYHDQMEDYICHLFGTRLEENVKRIGIKDYIKGMKKEGAKKKVAVLYACGEISRTGNQVAGEKFAAQVASLRKDESVAAVVFRVNSPGGEVVAADMIRREIELLGKEKPVIASYGAYAASGGYLISAGCRKIYLDNTTLTGSIGVFGMVPSFGKAVSKVLKVNLVNVGTHEHSSMGSGVNPLTPQEEEWYQREIEGIYADFVGVVSQGRGMTPEQVDDIAQGRVWAGKDALLIGLADEKGTLMDAISFAAKEAGLEKYKIDAYPEIKGTSLKELLGKDKSKPSKEPLVLLHEELSQPGFKALARIPYITFEPVSY